MLGPPVQFQSFTQSNMERLSAHSGMNEPLVTPFRKTLTNFELDDAPKSENKLHLVNGVMVPCLLHMIGILFFLRITWSVGEVGWPTTFA